MKRLVSGVAILVVAQAASLGLWNTSATSAGGPPTFELPAHAVVLAPGVYGLGQAVFEGRVVEGVAVSQPAVAPARGGKKGPPGGGNDDPPAPTPCTIGYMFESGIAWETAQPWVFNGNGSGIGVEASDLANAIAPWEQEVGDIFGDGADGAVDGADTNAPDGINEAYFARIVGRGSGNTIAVTLIWRDVASTEIVAWDQVYNTKYAWSLNPNIGDPDADAGEAGKMDFLAIATHEIGHAAGLGHTSGDCGSQAPTMAPTASYGDAHQRTLAQVDRDGISSLY